MANKWALTLAALLLSAHPACGQSSPNVVAQQTAVPQYQTGQVQYYAVPAQSGGQAVYVPQAVPQQQVPQALPNGAVVLVPVGRLSNGQIAYVIQQAQQQPVVQYVPVYIMPQSAGQQAQPQAAPAAAAPSQSSSAPAADPPAPASKHPIAKGVLTGLVNVGGALPGCSTGVTATQPLLNLLLQKM
jgi:hypothetical protein